VLFCDEVGQRIFIFLSFKKPAGWSERRCFKFGTSCQANPGGGGGSSAVTTDCRSKDANAAISKKRFNYAPWPCKLRSEFCRGKRMISEKKECQRKCLAGRWSTLFYPEPQRAQLTSNPVSKSRFFAT